LTEQVVFAPGRANLIGEHTDYSGGLVLPVAIDLGVTVSWRPAADAIRLRSLAFPETVELTTDGAPSGQLAGWGRYVGAVAQLLHERGRPPVGLEATVDSTIPIGAGLSSSAALIVGVGLALCRESDFDLPPLEFARLAQAAEQLAVGVPCGLMDPATSLLGRHGYALLLDCGTKKHRYVPLPPRVGIVVIDSGVRRQLERSGYADRRAELERGLAAIDRARPSSLTPAEAEAEACAAGVDEVAARRIRHVVSENERVRRCVAALERPGGADLPAIAVVFREGHESLRDDFEVSIPELDLLVDLAYEHGAIGARMMGGGFGGSIVALAELERAPSLVDAVTAAYAERTGREPAGYVCRSLDGAAHRSPRLLGNGYELESK
jgi:galactokinase